MRVNVVNLTMVGGENGALMSETGARSRAGPHSSLSRFTVGHPSVRHRFFTFRSEQGIYRRYLSSCASPVSLLGVEYSRKSRK